MTVEQPDVRLEIPTDWLAESGRLPTRDGDLDIEAARSALAARPEGATQTWAIDGGKITFTHRAITAPVDRSLQVTSGGFALSLDLSGSTLDGAFADLTVQTGDATVPITLDSAGEDALAPLKRAAPTVLFEGRTQKGKPVRIATR